MTFEDYRPKDRHLGGRAHLASWLVLAALIVILAIVVPSASSSERGHDVAASAAAERLT